jgi:Protein of unknown function (DUF1214)
LAVTYPKNALPGAKVRYFWSVIVVDNIDFKVVPNPLNRFLLNKQSALQYNADGSLTLAFAPKQPDVVDLIPTPYRQNIERIEKRGFVHAWCSRTGCHPVAFARSENVGE